MVPELQAGRGHPTAPEEQLMSTGETIPRSRTEDGTFTAQRAPGESLTREEIAGMTSDILKKLHARATAPRFYAKESDQNLMALVRAFVQGVTALNAVIRDRDLDELERRIAELEAAKESLERQREPPTRT